MTSDNKNKILFYNYTVHFTTLFNVSVYAITYPYTLARQRYKGDDESLWERVNEI